MNRNDEAYLFFKTSCTKDEAVGMLLGWMQGFTRPAAIKLNDRGTIPEDQLPLLQSLDEPLIDYISDLRNAAYEEFGALYEGEGTLEELDAQVAIVDRYNLLAEKAWGYLMDITDEIAKGDSSALRIDQEESNRSGTPHYTLRSVDAWAKGKLGVSIFKDQKSDQGDTPEGRREAIGESDLANSKGPSRTVSNHLNITLGLLTDLLSENKNTYKLNGKVNISQIAKHANELGRKYNKGEPIPGQSIESIKSRLEMAMKDKKSALPAA